MGKARKAHIPKTRRGWGASDCLGPACRSNQQLCLLFFYHIFFFKVTVLNVYQAKFLQLLSHLLDDHLPHLLSGTYDPYLPSLMDVFCLVLQSAVWQKVLQFPCWGWLVSGTHARVPLFLMAILGVFHWDRREGRPSTRSRE